MFLFCIILVYLLIIVYRRIPHVHTHINLVIDPTQGTYKAADLSAETIALKSLLDDKNVSLAEKDRLLQEHLAVRVSSGVPQVYTVPFCLSVYLLYFLV